LLHSFPYLSTSARYISRAYQLLFLTSIFGHTLKKHHNFSQIPKKKPRKGKLSVAEKKENKELAKERIIIENVFAHLKRFRILQGRYRNRRKRFGLRFNLIAAIYNYELNLNANQS